MAAPGRRPDGGVARLVFQALEQRTMMKNSYEDPNLLRLNAMLHRMERDRCLVLARHALRLAWLCGKRRFGRHLLSARDHHLLAKWFQHMAEHFDIENRSLVATEAREEGTARRVSLIEADDPGR